MVWINKYHIFVVLITFIMSTSFQTLQPNSVAPSLHSECDKPSGLGFNFMNQDKIPNWLNFNLISLEGEKWELLTKIGKKLNGKVLISNYGRLKSNKREVRNGKTSFRIIDECILKQYDNQRGKGYLCAHISDGRISKPFQSHRLVAKQFILNPLNLPEINHLDFDTKNNHVDNLEWSTKEDNIKHYQDELLRRMNNGERVANYRFTKDEIIDIFLSKDKYKDISVKYKVNWKTIGDIKSGATFKEITKHLPKNEKRREKLSKDKILDIYNNRHLTVKAMRDKYGLSEGAVIAIRTGRRYALITMHNRTFKRPCGENSRRSKLKNNDVIEILKSSKKCRELAKIYGVAHSQIHSIRSGKTWKHISSPHNERYGISES